MEIVINQRFQRILKIAYFIFILVTLFFIIIYPLQGLKQFKYKKAAHEISKYVRFYFKGVATWAFYTNSNDIINFGMFYYRNNQFFRIPYLPMKGINYVPLDKAHTIVRHHILAVAIMVRSPHHYLWICENFDIPEDRIHLVIGAEGVDLLKSLKRYPEDDFKFYLTKPSSKQNNVHMLSFRCEKKK